MLGTIERKFKAEGKVQSCPKEARVTSKAWEIKDMQATNQNKQEFRGTGASDSSGQ